MKFVLFFCYMYLGLSSYAFSQCAGEMKTIEWMQQLAEGAAADSGKQDSAAAGLTHGSQKIASQYLVKLRVVTSFIFL